MPNVGRHNASRAAAEVIYTDLVVSGNDVTEEINDLVASIRIDAHDLESEALEHASKFSRIAAISEEASSEARYAKTRLDIARAKLDADIRRDFATDGGKKPTEGAIENMITMDEHIISLKEELLEAERAAGIIMAFKQAFAARRDMIVEIMRNRRKEQDSYGGGISSE